MTTDTASLLAELQSANSSVQGNGWVSSELSGGSGGLNMLGSTTNPLTALTTAGLGFMTQLVSFLEEPLHQLRGNPDSVSSGSQAYGGAGQDVSDVANDYKQSTQNETSDWSGTSADDYRNAGSQHANGVSALGQASTTVASAIAGAGEVVGQAVGIITELVNEAVGKIVPIMTQAIAAAPATFGQSIAAAIPQCVQIAVEYGQKIAQKLGALLSSGQNLMKLVQGALAVVDTVKQVMSAISQQSTGTGTGTQSGTSTKSKTSPHSTYTPSTYTPTQSSFSSTPSSSSGIGTGTSLSGFAPSEGGAAAAAGAGGAANDSRAPFGGGVGAIAGKAQDTERPSAMAKAAAKATPAGSGMMGGAGGAHAGGEDKEHRRRFGLTEEEGFLAEELDGSVMVVRPVIGED